MARVTIYLMTPAPRPRRWRLELGYYGLDEDRGDIYLPAAAVGGDRLVFFAAAYDGVPCVRTDDNVMLYPARWLAHEYPDCAEDIAMVERRIRESSSGGRGNDPALRD
jgi:hypothetical protein